MRAVYERLLGELVAEAKQDDEVVGVLLTGSLARGDALPGTDVDLRVILGEGVSRPALHEVRGGVPVEWGYADEGAARAAVDANPMHVYAYLDGRILHDPQGVLVESLYGELFLGTAERRVEVALYLLDWILDELGEGRPAV